LKKFYPNNFIDHYEKIVMVKKTKDNEIIEDI
jgi:hypothetical protein